MTVVIGKRPGSDVYLAHFFEGVPEWALKYIWVSESNDMEPGHLKNALNQGFSKFVLLGDSMWIGKNRWDHFLAAVDTYNTAYVIPRPSCFALVYQASLLSQMHIPENGQDKEASIFNECALVDEYERLAIERGYTNGNSSLPVLYPSMTDGDAITADRFYLLNNERRLHLQSTCGTMNKAKFTYR